MSGQPNPPRILEAFAKNAPDCDPSSPIPGGKTNPFPATSQIGIVNGAASLVDGFVPLNMTDPTAGGVPPFGVDTNGILFLLSSWVANFASGQLPLYDATLQTAMGGYKIGAFLRKADGSGFWFSITDGNMTDPETGGAGWVGSTPRGSGYISVVPAAGNNNNYAPTGYNSSTNVLDLNPTGGDAIITGIAAGTDGQRLILTNVNATHSVVLSSMNASSSAANQLRLATDITLLTGMSVPIQYSTGAGLWIPS